MHRGTTKVIVSCEGRGMQRPTFAFHSLRRAKKFIRSLRELNDINCQIASVHPRVRRRRARVGYRKAA